MDKRGVLLLSGYVLIIAAVFLVAAALLMNVWLKPNLLASGSEMQTAAYTPDLDYWFVSRIYEMPKLYNERLYGKTIVAGDQDVDALAERLSEFGLEYMGSYNHPLPSSYEQAARGWMCPSAWDGAHFVGMPTIVCDEIYYTRDDRDSFEAVEGYDPSFWDELDRELSTFDTRSFAFYGRDAYVQDKDGRIIRLVADARLAK